MSDSQTAKVLEELREWFPRDPVNLVAEAQARATLLSVDELHTANLIAHRNYLHELHIENPTKHSDDLIAELSKTIDGRLGRNV